MLQIFLKIAWRDLWRHKLRTSLTLGAIVFGSAITLFFMAWARGGHQQMIRAVISNFPGYAQVHRAGYQLEQSIFRAMEQNPELISYLEQSPLVSGYSLRLCTDGLLQAGLNISGAKICGVIAEKEVKVSRIAQSFFPEMVKTPKGITTSRRVSGEFLSGENFQEMVLGEDLARNLQVKIGEKVSILAQDFYGSLGAGNFRVKGIFQIGAMEYDAGLALLDLKAFQELLYMPEQITHLVIMVKDTRALTKLSKEIYQLLSLEQGPWQLEGLSPGIFRIKPNKPNLEPDSPFQLAEQELLERAIKRIPGVRAYSCELVSRLSLNHKEIEVWGVAPDKESLVRKGSRKSFPITKDKDWVILKKELLDELGLKPGDFISLSGRNYLGEEFELKLRLLEGFSSEQEYSPSAFLPLDLLQERLRLGENVNQAIVQLSSKLDPETAKKLIYSRLNYEVVPWTELLPDLVQAITLDNVGAGLWLGILLIVIAFVFLLTILMSVLERERQFAIMKAIGTKPGEVFLVIFLESVFLGLLGSLIGLTLGAIPSLYFTYVPLDLSTFGESMGEYMEQYGFEPYLYAGLEPAMFFYTAVIIFSFVMIMTIFPGLKASRTKPAEKLRLQ